MLAPTSLGRRYLSCASSHLQLAFSGARSPGKDVENQLGAVDDLSMELPLEIPELRRAQLVVHDDEIHVRLVAGPRQQLHLALPQKQCRIRPAPLLDQLHDH